MERVASRTGFSLGNDHFTDLDYADDVVLFAHKMDDLHGALEVFETTASQLGLHISWQKTKIQNLGAGQSTPCPPVCGHSLEEATKFTYMGSVQSSGVFNFNFLSLVHVVSEILGGPWFTLGRPAPPGRPIAEKIVHKTSTLPYLMVFFNFNFLAPVVLTFQDIENLYSPYNCSNVKQGNEKKEKRLSQIYIRGPYASWKPPAEKKCTQSEYFTIYNGLFTFNFLARVLSERLRGPKFTLRSPAPTGRPVAENFLHTKRVL